MRDFSKPHHFSKPHQGRGLTAIDGALALMIVLLVVQVWLLSAALDAYLAGHRETALPAALASGVLFLICAGLFVMVNGLDRRERDESSRGSARSFPDRD